ncbi:MAG: hypothetical protein ACE5IH_07405 [Thermodesulfobacteriota bacterium]
MIIPILLFIFAMAATFFLLSPFREEKTWGYGGGEDILALEEKKEASLIAIHDIDFEHAAGKISEEDYETLRKNYKSDAIDIIKKIKEVEDSIMSLPPEEDIDPSLKKELMEEVVRIKRLKDRG